MQLGQLVARMASNEGGGAEGGQVLVVWCRGWPIPCGALLRGAKMVPAICMQAHKPASGGVLNAQSSSVQCRWREVNQLLREFLGPPRESVAPDEES